ncbi:hypothetical protein LXL04_027391 [Taraxacum kok-saghyz]
MARTCYALFMLLVLFTSSTNCRKLSDRREASPVEMSLYLTALPKGTVPASTPSQKGHASITDEKLITRHLIAIDRILRSVPMGYPRDAPATVLFGEWFRFGKPSDQKFLFEKTSFPRVHNFPIYAGTARSGNRVYVSSGKVAERKTKEIEIKSILCIPHEIRSRDGCGAKIEIKSILFKSRLGVDGIGMESAIHRNRNASGNDCDRVWDRLLQSENLKIAPLKIVQRRAEERAEEHLKWNQRRRARAEEMEMIEAVQVVTRGNGEACVQRNRRRRAGNDYFSRRDTLGWLGDSSDGLTVASACHLLDARFLSGGGPPTRWNSWIPIKLNVLNWRICNGILPTRERFSVRGILVDSIMCPVCSVAVETMEHLLAGCNQLLEIWGRIAIWWGVDRPDVISVASLLDWAVSLRINASQRKVFDAVIITTFWVLWNFRNNTVFGGSPPKKASIFDDIVNRSFFLVANRSKKTSLSWGSWLQNPVGLIDVTYFTTTHARFRQWTTGQSFMTNIFRIYGVECSRTRRRREAAEPKENGVAIFLNPLPANPR